MSASVMNLVDRLALSFVVILGAVPMLAIASAQL